MIRPLLLLVPALLAVSAPAMAQRRARQPAAASENTDAGERTGPAPTLADLGTIVPRLSSDNVDQVREAIDQLTIIDHPRVVEPLTELLRSGTPDAITDRTLDALGSLGHGAAVPVLSQFTHHRRAGARRRAYQALARVDDRRVPALIARGLSDSDRNVRAACALALGNLSARGHLDTLFRAFERGVVEAAIAIGKLGDRQSVERFSGYLGQQPLAIMLSGYERFLRRDDIPDRSKSDIVGQLGEVASPMAKRFLQDYRNSFSERDTRPLVRQLDEAIRRIRDQPTGAAQ